MKRLVVALLLAVAFIGLAPQPAHAGKLCEWFKICGHIELDDASKYLVIVTCDWNKKGDDRDVVYPGESDNCHDMDGVFIGENRELWCKPGASQPYKKSFDSYGWHKTRDYWDKKCRMHAD